MHLMHMPCDSILPVASLGQCVQHQMLWSVQTAASLPCSWVFLEACCGNATACWQPVECLDCVSTLVPRCCRLPLPFLQNSSQETRDRAADLAKQVWSVLAEAMSHSCCWLLLAVNLSIVLCMHNFQYNSSKQPAETAGSA